MTAYAEDPRVVRVEAGYVVDRRWVVMEGDSRWDAYRLINQHAADDTPAGSGTPSADEKIRELIGDPR